MKRTIAFLVFIHIYVLSFSQQEEYVVETDIPYYAKSVSEKNPYIGERCKLDIYYPKNSTDYPTVVWFHGGGLEGGEKHIPEGLKNKGIAVVAVNYRLSPRAQNPAYIEDAARATAWVFENIRKFKGSPSKIFISGHSAGGYLTLMVGLDKKYLATYNIDADTIKGLVPISGQTNTHYTIRKERDIPMDTPLIDEFAPLNQIRPVIPPILLITGDRRLEMTARYEENLHLEAVLKAKSKKNNVELLELQGFNHGTVLSPAIELLVDFVNKHKHE